MTRRGPTPCAHAVQGCKSRAATPTPTRRQEYLRNIGTSHASTSGRLSAVGRRRIQQRRVRAALRNSSVRERSTESRRMKTHVPPSSVTICGGRNGGDQERRPSPARKSTALTLLAFRASQLP